MARAQGFLSVQSQQAMQKKVAVSIVNVRFTYSPVGLQDPNFMTHEDFMGLVIGLHKVATTGIALKRPVESIYAFSLHGKLLARCTIGLNSKKTGIVVLNCPGLSKKPARIAKAPVKTGKALYSVQVVGGFTTLVRGLYKKKAPASLEGMFFVAGLNQPGMPLFDYKGRAVGLVIRSGIPFQSRTGVAAEIKRFDEINDSKHKNKGKEPNKKARTNQKK